MEPRSVKKGDRFRLLETVTWKGSDGIEIPAGTIVTANADYGELHATLYFKWPGAIGGWLSVSWSKVEPADDWPKSGDKARLKEASGVWIVTNRDTRCGSQLLLERGHEIEVLGPHSDPEWVWFKWEEDVGGRLAIRLDAIERVPAETPAPCEYKVGDSLRVIARCQCGLVGGPQVDLDVGDVVYYGRSSYVLSGCIRVEYGKVRYGLIPADCVAPVSLPFRRGDRLRLLSNYTWDFCNAAEPHPGIAIPRGTIITCDKMTTARVAFEWPAAPTGWLSLPHEYLTAAGPAGPHAFQVGDMARVKEGVPADFPRFELAFQGALEAGDLVRVTAVYEHRNYVQYMYAGGDPTRRRSHWLVDLVHLEPHASLPLPPPLPPPSPPYGVDDRVRLPGGATSLPPDCVCPWDVLWNNQHRCTCEAACRGI